MKKLLFLYIALGSFLYTQEYYNVDLNNTGVNQLIIFQSSISNLEDGDEIGIFDDNAILNSGDCSNQTGETLVGAGVWMESQVEVVSIGSVDNCAFGGFQLPGFVSGNSVTIKIYRPSTGFEYSSVATYSAGTGTFGDLFMAVSELELGDGQLSGCTDDTACNYNPDATDDDASCEYVEDCAGECGGSAVEDCAGECNGNAEQDICGECNGSSTDVSECLEYFIMDLDWTGASQLIIFQSAISNLEDGDEIGVFDNNAIINSGDCANQTGDALVGAGIWNSSQLELVSVGSIDNCAFGGFQLPGFVSGNSVTIKVYRPSNGVEYSSIATYSAGTGTFGDLFMAVSELEIFDPSLSGCTDEAACNYDSDATVDDGSCSYELDCAGECGGSAVEDCAGNCEGEAYFDLCNICSEGGSGHDANSDIDCLGECFGSALIDDCGVCNGENIDMDCAGECFGDAVVDECGICDNDFSNDCVQDCNGDWGGSALVDECGICEGPGAVYDCGCNDIPDGDCDCNENVIDECGICGGDNIDMDCSGECFGSNICGCTDEYALNYDLDATYDDGSCWYDVSYSQDIQPIFDANCVSCHQYGGNAENQVWLTSYSDLFNTSTWNNDNIIVPYDSENSFLIHALEGTASISQMPFYSDPLDQEVIDLIASWIDQGAVDDGGDGGGGGCPPGYMFDCDGLCQDSSLYGNGVCDDGTEQGQANFNCEEFYFDNADCPVGSLYFGDIDQESQLIPVYMDCLFSIENYAFSVSGLSGMTLSGGMLEDPSFQFDPQVFNDVNIVWASTQNDMPANYGLIFYIEYDEILTDICFESSTITTSAGFEYEADLGDCILFDSLDNELIFIPEDFNLGQAYPNPFNPTINIPFEISKPSNVSIDIYDLNGNKATNLVSNFYSSGSYSVIWDASGYASGNYFVVAEFGNEVRQQKIILMK